MKATTGVRSRRGFNLWSACLWICVLAVTPVVAAGLRVGNSPPDKLGRAASGEEINLNDYRGKVVIVSFWASWCGPCRREMSALTALQKAATRDQVAIFAVNWHESSERFRQITKALKDVDLTLVSDANGYYGAEYGVKAIPYMVIIGRDGHIASIHVGYGESEIPQLVAEINALLAKTSGPESSALPSSESQALATKTSASPAPGSQSAASEAPVN